MYAVIFRAELNHPDPDYPQVAAHLRELAISRYGCLDFISTVEENLEIAISYWPGLDNIQAWREDLEHRMAQERGKASWYRSWQVQVVEVVRDYGSGEPRQKEL